MADECMWRSRRPRQSIPKDVCPAMAQAVMTQLCSEVYCTERRRTTRRPTVTALRTLKNRLQGLELERADAWLMVGPNARPHLHGMLRYPAMMVPRMQGDILDAITSVAGIGWVADPFVGSGTVMTEALMRGLDFTGIDINPLAILVCEAKAAVDAGVDLDAVADKVLRSRRNDGSDGVDVDFPGLGKWFDETTAICLSRIRRAIAEVPDVGARKILWTVFAETIRGASNSRTSTYKLHVRPPGDRVEPDRIVASFELNVRRTMHRIAEYRDAIADRPMRPSDVRLHCADARHARFEPPGRRSHLLVTSPPYGDNRTTVPYGQFSYLALRWIPAIDLADGCAALSSNAEAMDTASLGGSMRGAAAKASRLTGISPRLDELVDASSTDERGPGLLKVACFVADLHDAFANLRRSAPGPAFWVLTVGNRTTRGVTVPLDQICRETLWPLGGRVVHEMKRRPPNKRMPLRNDKGTLINNETTLVFEFA